MIRTGLSAIALATLLLVAPAAMAQPAAPENGDARFTFHRAGDGYMRLDGRTGSVSSCNRRPSGWQCQAVPDERAALEAEIARLQADNAALKKELLGRSLPLPNGIHPDPPASVPNAQTSETRNEARLRRVMHEINKVWRRIVDMIASVQRDILNRT
jgi:hypothetical protein